MAQLTSTNNYPTYSVEGYIELIKHCQEEIHKALGITKEQAEGMPKLDKVAQDIVSYQRAINKMNEMINDNIKRSSI